MPQHVDQVERQIGIKSKQVRRGNLTDGLHLVDIIIVQDLPGSFPGDCTIACLHIVVIKYCEYRALIDGTMLVQYLGVIDLRHILQRGQDRGWCNNTFNVKNSAVRAEIVDCTVTELRNPWIGGIVLTEFGHGTDLTELLPEPVSGLNV